MTFVSEANPHPQTRASRGTAQPQHNELVSTTIQQKGQLETGGGTIWQATHGESVRRVAELAGGFLGFELARVRPHQRRQRARLLRGVPDWPIPATSAQARHPRQRDIGYTHARAPELLL